ncbi:MAG: leucine-rich repeat domain-containing protein [Candidatus Heimdallarchaeota archaeon]|nr:leucine-rich repeat domain-containing protein [Candidatus Heimdallarchaeota archaeon]
MSKLEKILDMIPKQRRDEIVWGLDEEEYITHLDLSGANLTSLPEAAFSELPSLDSIDLSDNNLMYLSEKHFSGCTAKTINLDGNFSLILANDCFQDLYIEELHLCITSKNNNMYLSIPSLATLSLSCTDSPSPDFLSGFPSLRAVNIDSHRSIPHDFFHNKHLLILRISGLKRIHAALFSPLDDLEELYLVDNTLKSIPEDLFKDLHKLKKLDLSGNGLKTINQEHLAGLENLEELDLSYNTLSLLEDDLFDNMHLLSRLDISGNLLEELKIGGTHLIFKG